MSLVYRTLLGSIYIVVKDCSVCIIYLFFKVGYWGFFWCSCHSYCIIYLILSFNFQKRRHKTHVIVDLPEKISGYARSYYGSPLIFMLFGFVLFLLRIIMNLSIKYPFKDGLFLHGYMMGVIILLLFSLISLVAVPWFRCKNARDKRVW